MTDTTSTAVATVAPKKAELVTGGSVAAIIPRNIEETFRLAGAIHASGLAPDSYKGPDQVMVAIMSGAEIGLSPMQSLQSIAVINGRVTLWGDGALAIVRTNKFRVREWCEGSGDERTAHCEVIRPDTEETIERTFSVAQAKKAGLWTKRGPWQDYPERMLQMRARAWAMRDGAADVLRGLSIREEVQDYTNVRDVTPAKSGLMQRLQGKGFHPSNVDQIDPETGEITDAVIEEVSPVAEQVSAAVTALRHAGTRADLEAAKLDGEHIAGASPEERTWLRETYEARLKELSIAEPQSEPETAEFSDVSTSQAATEPTLGLDEPKPEAPDVDGLLDWAASYLRGLAAMTDQDEVKASWLSDTVRAQAKALKRVKPQMADQLVDAFNAKVKELQG
jgi:hypothetical protein